MPAFWWHKMKDIQMLSSYIFRKRTRIWRVEIYIRSCTVVWWLAPSPHWEGSRFNPGTPAGAFLCGLCMFSLCMHGLSPGTSFHCPKICMLGSLVTLKLSLGVSVSVHVSFVSFVSVWPCDGLVTCPGCTLPQPPRNPTDRWSGYRKWMDVLLNCQNRFSHIIVYWLTVRRYNSPF